MTYIFKILKITFIFLFSIIFIYIASIFLDINIAKGVTKTKILSLKTGMTKEKVIAILGKPIEIINHGKNYEENNIKLYRYANANFSNSGLEINIEISNEKLDGIGIELDDTPFYWCYNGYANSCPKIISPFLWKYLIPND